MVKSRHKIMKDKDDFNKTCITCKMRKEFVDDNNQVVLSACHVDGEPLGNKWPIHITTCDKYR